MTGIKSNIARQLVLADLREGLVALRTSAPGSLLAHHRHGYLCGQIRAHAFHGLLSSVEASRLADLALNALKHCMIPFPGVRQ